MFVKFSDVTKMMQTRLESLKCPENQKPIKLFRISTKGSQSHFITEEEFNSGDGDKVFYGNVLTSEELSKKIAARAEMEEQTASPIRSHVMKFFYELREHMTSSIDKLQKETLETFCPTAGGSMDFIEDFDSGALNDDEEFLRRLQEILGNVEKRQFMRPKKLSTEERTIIVSHIKKLDMEMKKTIDEFYSGFKGDLFRILSSKNRTEDPWTELFHFKAASSFRDSLCLSFNPQKYDEYCFMDDIGRVEIFSNGNYLVSSIVGVTYEKEKGTVRFNQTGSLLLISSSQKVSLYDKTKKRLGFLYSFRAPVEDTAWVGHNQFLVLTKDRVISKMEAQVVMDLYEIKAPSKYQDHLLEHDYSLMALDGSNVYLGNSQGHLGICDINSLKPTMHLVGHHHDAILAMAVNHEKNQLLSGGADFTLILMDLVHKKVTWRLKLGYSIHQIIWSNNDKEVYVLLPVDESILKVDAWHKTILAKRELKVENGTMACMAIDYFESIMMIAGTTGDIHFLNLLV